MALQRIAFGATRLTLARSSPASARWTRRMQHAMLDWNLAVFAALSRTIPRITNAHTTHS